MDEALFIALLIMSTSLFGCTTSDSDWLTAFDSCMDAFDEEQGQIITQAGHPAFYCRKVANHYAGEHWIAASSQNQSP